MKTSRTKIAHTIATNTLSEGVSKQFSKEVAAYLLAEHRVSDLDSLLRDVQADWAAAGKVSVIASSAHPLNEAIKKEITAQVRRVYPGAQIIVTELRDETVIGGVRLQFANQQLDISVQGKLNKFKQLTSAGKD